MSFCGLFVGRKLGGERLGLGAKSCDNHARANANNTKVGRKLE